MGEAEGLPEHQATSAGTSTTRASALVILSACCFAAIPILTTLATRAGMPLVEVLGSRYAAGALFLIPMMGGIGALAIDGRRITRLMLLGGAAQAVLAFTSLSALRYIPAATMVFLFYTFPAWVALFAVLRGTERVDRTRGIALLLSFAGIAVMVGMPGTDAIHPLGFALALSAALMYALYIPMLGALQKGLPTSVASFYVVAGAALILLAVGALTGQLTTNVAPIAWWSIAALGLFSTAVAFIAFLRGLEILGPVRTAIISTVEPFCVAILGWLVLDQRITPPVLVGGGMIAGAVYLLQRRGSRAEGRGPRE